MTSQLNDPRMSELFSAFDDVHASDELAARTLDAIFGESAEQVEAPSAGPGAGAGPGTPGAPGAAGAPSGAAGANSTASVGTPAEAIAVSATSVEVPATPLPLVRPEAAVAESAESRDPSAVEAPHEGATSGEFSGGAAKRDETPVKAVARGKAARARLRIVRLVAAAACFVALAVGGVAYAVPASSVTVLVGDSAIDLGVNCFGLTVSATADDEDVQRLIDEANVRNLSYDEALGRVLDSVDASREAPVQVSVKSGDEHARQQMEERSLQVVDEHRPNARTTQNDGQSGESAQPAYRPQGASSPSPEREGTPSPSPEREGALSPSPQYDGASAQIAPAGTDLEPSGSTQRERAETPPSPDPAQGGESPNGEPSGDGESPDAGSGPRPSSGSGSDAAPGSSSGSGAAAGSSSSSDSGAAAGSSSSSGSGAAAPSTPPPRGDAPQAPQGA